MSGNGVAEEKPPKLFQHIRHPQKRAFLRALIETAGNVVQACEAVGIDRTTPYTAQWRDDPEFAEAKVEAMALATEQLEAEAIRRAYNGVKKPVGWYKGEPGGYVTEYSDNLLMFTLKGRLPDKYRDRLEVRGAIAHVDLTQLPPDLLARIAGGEHPLSVLASAADALQLGPGVEVGEGEAPAGEDSAHIEDGGDE